VICAEERLVPISGPEIDGELEGWLPRLRKRLGGDDPPDPDTTFRKSSNVMGGVSVRA
jgi:hypothetical protein